MSHVDPVRDGGFGQAVSQGVSGACFTSADQSASAAPVTDAPASGKKLVILDVWVSVGATAQTVTLACETTGVVLWRGYFPANTPPVQITPRGKVKLATADKRLTAQTSASGNVAVMTTYCSED